MSYAGIVFDFNGVLLWDAPLHEAAWQEMAQAARGQPMSRAELDHEMHGRTNAHIWSYLLGRPVVAAELAMLTDRKESRYRELCLAHPELFRLSPGAAELLDWLVAHEIPRGIATSSERSNLDFFIEHLALARWFPPAHLVYDDGTLPGKPAPDFYLRAAERLGLPPARCIVVEDALSGIAAAHAAGIGCIVALGQQAAHPRLRSQPGVSLAIASLADFPRETLLGGTSG